MKERDTSSEKTSISDLKVKSYVRKYLFEINVLSTLKIIICSEGKKA